ncbi:ABC transporter ATP-binding protein [Methylocapsa sp. S129]|uniref:ABC transporter ATP-binding protein n=1 Tax=Methylocapsa sp. S129 TaxID=1641869 RepID=UPI00131B3D24|nr:ABC transporter ATP-binding protein [Methylocapsa sp. S129]
MLLEVAELSVDLPTSGGVRRIVRSASFALDHGQTLGIVGESGSGKTMTALALMGLLPDGATTSGAILFEGRDLLKLNEAQMRDLRGDRVAMIFQEPMTALNPLHSIGRQIAEPLILHRGLSNAAAHAEAVRLLERVGLPDPVRRARAYPHQLSGGQRQRAMIAMALGCAPRLIIADEPTTALDVTVQAQILDLIADLGAQSDMALILVSHDLAVIAQNCERVLVMYGGMAMESGRTDDVLARPAHPYTKALLQARPRVGARRGERLQAIAGAAPSAGAMPKGCPFAGRCPLTIAACGEALPAPVMLGGDHMARCIRIDAAERAA